MTIIKQPVSNTISSNRILDFLNYIKLLTSNQPQKFEARRNVVWSAACKSRVSNILYVPDPKLHIFLSFDIIIFLCIVGSKIKKLAHLKTEEKNRLLNISPPLMWESLGTDFQIVFLLGFSGVLLPRQLLIYIYMQRKFNLHSDFPINGLLQWMVH